MANTYLPNGSRVRITWPMNARKIAIRTGMGMTLKSFPPPRLLKPAGSPKTGTPPVKRREKPLAMPIIPRVAIKGGKCPQAIRKPETAPHRVPVRRPVMTEGKIPIPDAIIMVVAIPDTARMDPTERSIPPEMITII